MVLCIRAAYLGQLQWGCFHTPSSNCCVRLSFFPPPRPKAFICIRWNSKMCLIQQKGNYVFLSITALIEKRLLWGGAARLALGVRNSFC